MKKIIGYAPDAVEVALYDLNPEEYIEDFDIYNHFYEIYNNDFNEHIDANYSKKKGRLLTLENFKDVYFKSKSSIQKAIFESGSPDAIKVHLMFENQRIYVKYVVDFDAKRKRFYYHKGNYYSYSINAMPGSVDPPIILHQWNAQEIENVLNVYGILRNKSFIKTLFDKLFSK